MRARMREHYEDFQIRITDHKRKQKTKKAGREKDVRNCSRARGADYTPKGYKKILSISYLFHTVRPPGMRAGTKGTPCVLAHAPRTSATRQARPAWGDGEASVPLAAISSHLPFPDCILRYKQKNSTAFLKNSSFFPRQYNKIS